MGKVELKMMRNQSGVSGTKENELVVRERELMRWRGWKGNRGCVGVWENWNVTMQVEIPC